MRSERKVEYAGSGGLQIAYEVIGEGPLDIVVAFEWGSNLDLVWENPRIERFLRRFGEYGRLIHVDLRGNGLSDPVDSLPPLEAWVDDLQAVLTAVGSRRTALIGHGHAAQLCMLFAAMHPDRTSALVTLNGFARMRRAPDYPWGYPPLAEQDVVRAISTNWGTGETLTSINPSLGDGPRGLEWVSRLERASGSPRRAANKQRLVFDIDVRDVLPAISVPTLVVHTRENTFAHPGHARYLVENIAGARFVELEGADHSPWASAEADALMDVIEEFLTGSKRAPATDRSLMTVAFTDIVGSTEMAATLGDRQWRGLLEIHESTSRREIETARGRVIKSTGDGLLATFDGPARAVQCLRSIGTRLAPLALQIRAGVHTGEVELIGDDIGGIAVHIASRITALAGAGEVLASSTVRDLVAGSGLIFEDRGEHALKGVPDPWRLFADITP
ncbi:MAG: adenylate/guanylate cyclase domain-containing protein [Nocardioides sp.]